MRPHAAIIQDVEILAKPTGDQQYDARSDDPRAFNRERCFYLVTLLVITLLWALDMQRLQRPLFELDDAYITLHNAQVLLSGQDPNYSGVHPLTGATSAIHLALVTVALFFVEPLWALHLANWLAILLYGLGLARLAFQHRASCLQAALLVTAGLIVADTPSILLNGLETGLAMAGIVWALVAATTPEPSRWLPVICGLLPFLRPELTGLSLLLMIYQFGRRWGTHRTVRHTLRAAALDAAATVVVAAPWVLWYWISTGVPYPSTIEAKRDFFAEGLLSSGYRSQIILTALGSFLLTVGAFGWTAALLPWTRVGRIGLLFCALFLVSFYAVFPSALTYNQQRYLYVLLPMLLYAAASWLASPRQGLRLTATCLLLVGVAQSAVSFPARWRACLVRRRVFTTTRETVTEWCQGHLPADTRLLIHDAGYMSYATAFPLTDFVGLKTPECIREHRELTWTSAGRRRVEAIQRIARRNQARYLVLTDEWDGLFHITRGLQDLGWKAEPLRRPPVFYQVYHLTPPGVVPEAGARSFSPPGGNRRAPATVKPRNRLAAWRRGVG